MSLRDLSRFVNAAVKLIPDDMNDPAKFFRKLCMCHFSSLVFEYSNKANYDEKTKQYKVELNGKLYVFQIKGESGFKLLVMM